MTNLNAKFTFDYLRDIQLDINYSDMLNKLVVRPPAIRRLLEDDIASLNNLTLLQFRARSHRIHATSQHRVRHRSCVKATRTEIALPPHYDRYF